MEKEKYIHHIGIYMINELIIARIFMENTQWNIHISRYREQCHSFPSNYLTKYFYFDKCLILTCII